MSNSFIGSKIAIVTKSQSRYSGTIIGIDAQASSIVLGNVKCFGTENRLGAISSGQLTGNLVPIMQFNNSDIEDLKIVDEEQSAAAAATKSSATTTSTTTTVVAPEKPTSIHDDPAIVSAVISSTTKDTNSLPNRIIQDLHHLSLSGDSETVLPKKEESRIRTDSDDLTGSWSLLSPSKWNNGNSSIQAQNLSSNKSKFFDNFALNATDNGHSSNRPHRWGSSNNHATQTSYRSNQNGDERDLPTRQPFFSDEPPFPSQQRNFNQQRRGVHRRRPMNGGNRETFYDNGNLYDDEFDFESSNRKFHKITDEDQLKQPMDFIHQNKVPIDNHQQANGDFHPVYDKKKSFFDNISLQETTDLPVPIYHRTRNQDTFGNNHHNDRFHQRPKFRGHGNGSSSHRRSNYNSNQNGYQYRY